MIDRPLSSEIEKGSENSSMMLRMPDLDVGSQVVYLVNDLFCYDIDQNCWQHPVQRGDLPTPRIGSLTINNDGKIFLFGGMYIRRPQLFRIFGPPSPFVTVTLTQLITTLVCFWGTPSQCGHHIMYMPLLEVSDINLTSGTTTSTP